MSEFWQGVLVSAFVLIGGGVLTQLISVPIAETIQRRIQNYRDSLLNQWATSSRERLRHRIESLKEQRASVEEYVESPSKFIAFLCDIGAELLMLSSLAWLIFIKGDSSWVDYVILFWFLYLMWKINQVVDIARGVRYFDSYQARIAEQIANLEAILSSKEQNA